MGCESAAMQVARFFFDDFWHFMALLILVGAVAEGIGQFGRR
jgi:hypothetical protein